MGLTRDEAQRLAHHLEPMLFIGGKRAPAADGATVPTVDPATGRTLREVSAAGPADIDAAVTAARLAAEDWRRTPPRERGRMVRRFATMVAEHGAQLAALDALDGGFPLASMDADLERAVELLEVLADAALEVKGETIPLTSDHLHYTVAEPYGVVGRIIPFNHPAFFAATKLAAPLVTGNCVVLKPPDQAPLSALYLADLLSECFPEGVVSVLTGTGPVAGDALVRHPLVRRIAFIGSVATGLAIQRAASETGVKMVTLELGGKNALIAFDDADPSHVAVQAVAGMNFTASHGQSCGSTSRLMLHESIAEEVIDEVATAIAALRVGDPFDDVDMGPLISEAQLEKALSYITRATRDGARLLVGGGAPAGTGWFVEPTMLVDVAPDAPVAREEIFGPVLSVLSFATEAEAIEVANSVDYGLTAAIFTNDLARAHRMADSVEAGYVWINETSRHYWGAPFGGFKASGVGREEHLEELRSFTQTKAVHVPFR